MIKLYSSASKCIVFIVLITILSASLLVVPAAAAINDTVQARPEGDGGGSGTNANINYEGNFSFDDITSFDFGSVLDEGDQKAQEELSGIKLGVYHLTKFKKISSSAVTTLAASTVVAGSKIVQSNRGWVKGFQDGFLVVGKLLCILYFLLSLMDSASRDSFTIDVFVKSLAKLVIIFVIFSPETIEKITYFARAFEYQTLQIIHDVNIRSEDVGALTSYVTEIKNASFFAVFGFLLSTDALLSFTNICSIIVAACISFSRAIEILAYQTFLPLAMGSIYDGGLRSPGMRYIKKWLALYLQGAVIIVVAALGGLLVRDALNIPGLGVLLDIAYAFVLISLLTKSKSIANDIMGV